MELGPAGCSHSRVESCLSVVLFRLRLSPALGREPHVSFLVLLEAAAAWWRLLPSSQIRWKHHGAWCGTQKGRGTMCFLFQTTRGRFVAPSVPVTPGYYPIWVNHGGRIWTLGTARFQFRPAIPRFAAAFLILQLFTSIGMLCRPSRNKFGGLDQGAGVE